MKSTYYVSGNDGIICFNSQLEAFNQFCRFMSWMQYSNLTNLQEPVHPYISFGRIMTDDDDNFISFVIDKETVWDFSKGTFRIINK